MKYERPSIATLMAASVAIQGGIKTNPVTDAGGQHLHPSTGGAYDLDE